MKNYFQIFKLLWSANRTSLTLIVIICILSSFLPTIMLYLTNEIVNSVTSLLNKNEYNFQEPIILILLQLSVMGVANISETWRNILELKLEYKLEYLIESKMMYKVRNINYEWYERTEFYNQVGRITNSNISNTILSQANVFLSTASSIITLFSIIGLLLKIHYSIVFLSLIFFIPILLINSKFGKDNFNLIKFQMPFYRKTQYIKGLMYNKVSIKEISLFKIYDYLFKKWEKLFDDNLKETLRLHTKQEKTKIILEVFKTIMYGLTVILLLYLVITKEKTIGDFVMGLQGIEQIQLMVSSIAIGLSELYSNRFYLNDYFTFDNFLNSEGEKTDIKNKIELNSIKKIEFINASFSYPDNKQLSLDNVSLTIHPNEKIGIIGENGSGKTTLIHCLMGLYELKSGELRINNKNINELNMENYREKITAIFQDYVKYAFSIKENIILTEPSDYNDTSLQKAVNNSGVKEIINKLPNGIDTVLGKVFEKGHDLSGGQWQKIAIARSIYRNSDVIILDEPTASLDPKSEAEIFGQYMNLLSGKIGIFITHRMAYVKNLDRIILMKNGKIIEHGNHNDLMHLKGEYFEMYNEQARVYGYESEKYHV